MYITGSRLVAVSFCSCFYGLLFTEKWFTIYYIVCMYNVKTNSVQYNTLKILSLQYFYFTPRALPLKHIHCTRSSLSSSINKSHHEYVYVDVRSVQVLQHFLLNFFVRFFGATSARLLYILSFRFATNVQARAIPSQRHTTTMMLEFSLRLRMCVVYVVLVIAA